MATNYYDILGVSRDATNDEIKKAYRTLTLKWHPDRNSSKEAEEKIREINMAYEILSDPQKKQQHDMELDNPFLQRSNGFDANGMHDMSDIINMMFSGGMPFMGGHGGIHEVHFGGPGGPQIRVFGQGGGGFTHVFQQMQKPAPIIQNVPATLRQMYEGSIIPVEIVKWTIENEMKIHERAIFNIQIPKGIAEGEIIVLRDCGNKINDQLIGDVKIVIQNAPSQESEIFKRNGMDLHYSATISLKEALTGFSFEIPHLNNKVLRINNTANKTVIKPNHTHTLKELGMIKEGHPTGNLIVEFKIEFPPSLTEDQIAKLSEIL